MQIIIFLCLHQHTQYNENKEMNPENSLADIENFNDIILFHALRLIKLEKEKFNKK